MKRYRYSVSSFEIGVDRTLDWHHYRYADSAQDAMEAMNFLRATGVPVRIKKEPI